MSNARQSLWVVVVVALAGGCDKLTHRCADNDCLFTQDEWKVVKGLADVASGPPPADPSNAYLPLDRDGAWAAARKEGATFDELPIVRLGWRLYHDPRLSGFDTDSTGRPTAVDSLGRLTPVPRLPAMSATCGAQLRISCASCHDPAAYGSDFTSQPPNVSNGAGWYDVNTQQTLNVARFFPTFYWNGRSDSLWSQAAQVMESPVSMNGHRLKTFMVVSRYYLSPAAPDSYDRAFGEADVDAIRALGARFPALLDTTATAEFKSAYAASDQKDLVNRVHVNVAKAIAAYEWFLTSDDSRFDRFVDEGPSSGQLTPPEKRGLKLFIGHAGCIGCHNTSLFSDGKFHNIGVPQAGEHVPTFAACVGGSTTATCDCHTPAARDGGAAGSDGDISAAASDAPFGTGVGGACLPAGAYAGLQKLHGSTKVTSPPTTTVFRQCSCFDDRYADDPDCKAGGLGEQFGCDAGTGVDGEVVAPETPVELLGAWRTPSLRDVAMTGPYMHDGIFATLADVVWHYDQGAAAESLGKSQLAPLDLSNQDRDDLVAFLGTLTGTPGPRALIAKPPDSYPCAANADSDAGVGPEAGTSPDAPDEDGDGP